MVVVLPKYGIAYFPMRKVGTTSVKRMLKSICATENEYQSTYDVPMSPRQRWLARGHFKFTVVRDPVSYVLSCYRNRVAHYHDVSRHWVNRTAARLYGLTPTPDVDEFCQNLHRYRLINSSIRRHSRLQSISLGRDLSFFDAIYPIAKLDQLALDLSKRTGLTITIPHLRTDGPKICFDDLTHDSQKAVLAYTARDYDLLKDYFTPPQLSH